MNRWSASDEQRHRPDDDRWWSEMWSFEFRCPYRSIDPANGVGGYAELTLLPVQRRAWYWAALVGPGRPLVALSDVEVPWTSRSLEIRSEGLWADHICEDPLRRWTIGNEAFAVAFDHPDVALGDARGTLVPLGFDLEWEASAEPVAVTAGDGYEIDAEVHGYVLVGSERLDVTAIGRWSHRWGRHSWMPIAARHDHDHDHDHDHNDNDNDNDERSLRAPVRVEIDADVMALDRRLGPDGWHSSLRPLSRRGDGGRTPPRPAAS